LAAAADVEGEAEVSGGSVGDAFGEERGVGGVDAVADELGVIRLAEGAGAVGGAEDGV
jgi:hypothetical protein